MADNERKTTLKIAGDAGDFKSATEQVKQAGRDMAQSVAQSAQQASKAVTGMGDGAASAAQKIGAAQSGVVDAVKKSTEQFTQAQQRFLASTEKTAIIATQGKQRGSNTGPRSLKSATPRRRLSRGFARPNKGQPPSATLPRRRRINCARWPRR
jgi:hypothetical protein